jgi:hypothetical protein
MRPDGSACDLPDYWDAEQRRRSVEGWYRVTVDLAARADRALGRVSAARRADGGRLGERRPSRRAATSSIPLPATG